MKLDPLSFSDALTGRDGKFVPSFQRWLTKLRELFGDIRQNARYPLSDHFADIGNVGTGEDDLYSDSIPRGQLIANGDKLSAEYSGIIVFSATATREIRAYFGGTKIFDSGALAVVGSNTAWRLSIRVIRETSAIVRCFVEFGTRAANVVDPAYTRITGLTLTDAQVLKVTGEAAGVGAATNDIVLKFGTIEYEVAA